MQLNVIVFVLLLKVLNLEKIYSVPVQIFNKGILLNELIRYYEPAMYTPEEVQYYHNRRRREVDGLYFNKPLKISFKAHDRNFNLILRSDHGIFANDVVFDSTSRTVNYDTRRVYTGVLEGEEDSLVQGVVTKEGFFDGTIFTQTEMYFVEPVSRYTPSSHQHQNLSSLPKNIHTIIYKTTDVKIPPSLKNPCASQVLYLSKTKNNLINERTKRSFRSESSVFSSNEGFNQFFYIENSSNISPVLKKNFVIPHRKHKSKKNGVSSLPIVSSPNELIDSNILKTYLNSHEDDRTRKKIKDTHVLKQPTQFRDTKVLLHSNNNMINRPRFFLNKTVSRFNQTSSRYQDFDVLPNGTLKHLNKRATIDPKKTTCMLYLQADHLFYQKYGTEEACIEVMTRHVQRVNAIYKNTDFNQDGKNDNISFMIKRIKVHTSDSSKDPSYRFPGNYGVEKFLELFSEEDYDAFCLAYMFTYRDFEMGTLGLAWTGDLKNAGGVCEKNGHYRGSLKSLNTGIVTLLNYGKHVPPAVSHVTLAHEIGHNFGSPHDPESCTPGGEDGNYIMFARATSGDKKNNNKFSPCSLNSINPVLNSKARSQTGCFTEPQVAICGNGVVEAGEDCDCGWEEDCRDSCCYPQRRYPPAGEPPCKLTPNSVCSPSQGPCCTFECQLKFGDKCRDDNGCRDSSYCDGRSPSCPPSVNKPNKTICNDEFVCFMGECTGSICLAYGLESCQCIPGPKDSLTKACELCCKKPGDDQLCISSFEWNESPYDVPDMFSKPGTPCNDYNGYCDVFQKCREVDPSGPLATLRKLLLSEESLASFKRWVTEHWYAVLAIVISIIFLLVLSTKLLGKHQGAKLKLVTIIHSSTAETVRLPPEGDAGFTVHPPAVRNKLPLNRKVREKKLHTKVLSKKKSKSKDLEEGNGIKIKSDKSKTKSTANPQKLNSEVPSKRNTCKESNKSRKNIKAVVDKADVPEKTGKTQRIKKINLVAPETANDAKKPYKHKSKEECSQTEIPEKGHCLAAEAQAGSKKDFDKGNLTTEPLTVAPESTHKNTPIYEKVEDNRNLELSSAKTSLETQGEKIKNSRGKRPNHASPKASEAAKKIKEDNSGKEDTQISSKIKLKGKMRPKTSPKKKKNTAEVIEYNNEVLQATSGKTTTIPSEDPVGKVHNWLMHSISIGKTSENFGIMTLTLPKSKSSPVGFSSTSKSSETQVKISSPPKIIHKSDKLVQIPKLTQKKSRSTGNLKKSEKKEEKMKLQVVYKPPFKFSVKFRNNKILGAVGTKILDEKTNSKQIIRKSVTSENGKVQRAAVLVRTSKRKSKNHKREKKIKNPTQVNSADKENSTENPFTFPSGVAPMSLVSMNTKQNTKQLPIYLTDQEDIDSNVHTVPSDLDVLLSESKFLFPDA